jgi:hypothetical protein
MDNDLASNDVTSADRKDGMDRRSLLSGLAVLPALSRWLLPVPARAQNAATDAGFSFVAVGDTRPMMYLPYKDRQPDAVKFFVEMFGLIMPEKVAEEVVKKDVKMTFDPVTKELIQIEMPSVTRSEVMTLKVDKGWVTEASVEDVTASRSAPDDVPPPGRRMGRTGDRERRQHRPC